MSQWAPKPGSEQFKCVSTKQYEDWFSYIRGNPGRMGFCGDCLPEYQLRMAGLGCCVNTTIQFYTVDGVTVAYPSKRKVSE